MLKSIWTGFNAIRLMAASPLFDETYYAKKYHIPRRLCVLYDVVIGRRFANDPSEEFSAKKYLETYPDIKNSRMPALYHYLKHGEKEGRVYESCTEEIERCPLLNLFDGGWYRKNYLTDRSSEYSGPLDHYLNMGWKQGCKPFESFDADRFYRENTDCREEPLGYWYKKRLPTLYINDIVAFEQNGSSRIKKALQYLYHYAQDGMTERFLPADESETAVTIYIAPDYGEQNLGILFAFQACMEDAHDNKGERECVVAATMPAAPTYTGEGLFPEPVRILRFSQISFRLHNREQVTLVIPDIQLERFLEYLKYNAEDPFSRVSHKTLRLLDYGRLGSIRELAHRAERWFDTVTVEAAEPARTYENPYLGFFDEEWYKNEYFSASENARGTDPRWHYLHLGWREHNKPFRYFDIDRFYREHPTCHYEPLYYLYRNRIPEYYFTESAIPKMHLKDEAGRALQVLYRIRQEALADKILPVHNTVGKLLVILVSPEDAISGGIMSFYGIYHLSQQLKSVHGRTVVAATIPGDTTHAGFTMFKNDMPVLRYDQIIRRAGCVDDVLIMVPELYVPHYLKYMVSNTDDPLMNARKTQLNILNQRIELMPEPNVIEEMKLYFPYITQTAAHYKYCTQRERDCYGIPMHLLLPPIIKEFSLIPYEEKENIFAYSYDEQPWKKKLLGILKAEFPELRFREIRGISFDEYLALIHRAKWCMTFGEGLDGYFSEPYQAGGISFAVWNDDYFTERYKALPTVIPSVEDAMKNLPSLMRRLDNKEEYEKASALVREVHGQEYANGRTSRDQLIDFFENRLDYP